MTFSVITNDAFREVFQSMSEGIVMVDESGKIEIANGVAEKLFGYEENGLRGILIENLLPERFRGRHLSFRNNFNARPEPRRMGVGRDLTALRKDGSEFPVEISLSFTHVDNKLFVMAFISDITLRKQAEEAVKRSEEQLIEYAAELEQKVKARTEDLNNSILKLEKEVIERKKAEEEARKSLEKERELNELKTKFVSIASHEFRTPLSTVLGSIDLIEHYKNEKDFEKQVKHIDRIRNSVHDLTQILNDFLSLGRLEEGKVEVNTEPININTFLHDIKDEVQNFLKDKQLVVIRCQPGVDTISTDGRILKNILLNLISNASKYSDSGKLITIDCDKKNSNIVFQVIDNGIGIPEEDQKHLFDRFFRASNAGNVQGTGLGLNIVKRYVGLLRGKIGFTSEYGKGSTFYIEIPPIT